MFIAWVRSLPVEAFEFLMTFSIVPPEVCVALCLKCYAQVIVCQVICLFNCKCLQILGKRRSSQVVFKREQRVETAGQYSSECRDNQRHKRCAYQREFRDGGQQGATEGLVPAW
jgi:hypothetical protein